MKAVLFVFIPEALGISGEIGDFFYFQEMSIF